MSTQQHTRVCRVRVCRVLLFSYDTPAAHLLERIILKIQRSFPEHSIRSDECVLILERLSVGSRDLCWIGRELLVGNHLGQSVAYRHSVCLFLISNADLGDEVAKSGEEALELATDKKQLVDSK